MRLTSEMTSSKLWRVVVELLNLVGRHADEREDELSDELLHMRFEQRPGSFRLDAVHISHQYRAVRL